MDQQAFSRYLSDRYEDQISWYDRKAELNQRIYSWLQWLLIVLAALTPALVEFGANLPLGDKTLKVATLTGLIVAILTAGLKAFKYQENWINYRTTCETLRKERYFFDAGIGDYRDAEDKMSLFVDRVENLISRENTLWLSAHETKRNGENDKKSRSK